MSKTHEAHVETVAAEAPAKVRKPRSPAKPRTVYAVVEVLDEAGNTVSFDKTRIRLLNIETKADNVLDILEGGNHPHAMLLKGTVAPGR